MLRMKWGFAYFTGLCGEEHLEGIFFPLHLGAECLPDNV